MKRLLQILTCASAIFLVSSCEPVDSTVYVQSVSLSETAVDMVEGDVLNLAAIVSPSDATNKNLSWSSSTADVASVDNGKVTALKPGNAVITVKTEDGGKTASCNVTVKNKGVPVQSVALDKSSAEMTEGDELTLVATIAPDNATNKNLSWSSSAADVASVDNGKVTALKPGSAVITVKTEDGGKTASCEITVKAQIIKDVENVSDLKASINTPADKFSVSWTGVANAVSYKCWYFAVDDEYYKVEVEAKDNGDGSWTANSNSSVGANTYIFCVQPVPAEGHALKDENPASIEIVLPKWDNLAFSYNKLLLDAKEGEEYEADSYGFKVKYKNVRYMKPDRTISITDDWYLYTATPVEDINHFVIWYSLDYDKQNESIKVYSSEEAGFKQTKLTPEAQVLSGKWKVTYKVPQGHKYLYVQGSSKKDYLIWSGFNIYHKAKE